MKTIFTPTLPPDAKWFNSIQNANWYGGCKDGQYKPVSVKDVVSLDNLFARKDQGLLANVIFGAGVSVPSPDTSQSPINRSYLDSTLATAALNVSAPGIWVSYSKGVLECPVRAREFKPAPGILDITTAIGLDFKSWLVEYAPNSSPKEGVVFGSSFFTIPNVETKPSTVNVAVTPPSLGVYQGNSGNNYTEAAWVPETKTIRVNIGQATVPKRYIVTISY